MTRAVLLVISVGALAGSFWYGRLRWDRLNLLDLWILMVGAYFGGYTLLDTVVVESEERGVTTLIWTFLLILIPVVVTALWARTLPARSRLRLDVRERLRWLGRTVDMRQVGWLLAALVGFTFFRLSRYGAINAAGERDLLAAGEAPPPYWVTSLASFVNPLLVAIFLVASTGYFNPYATRSSRRFNLVVMVVAAALAGLSGRRLVFVFLVLTVVVWSITRDTNPFLPNRVPTLILGFVGLLIASNLFQAYRPILVKPFTQGPSFEWVSPIDAALDAEGTFENLRSREGTWKFNYAIVAAQTEGVEPMYGEVWTSAITNSIPSVLRPDKETVSTDLLIGEYYVIPGVDFSSNNFATYQADFGLVSVVLLPVHMMAVLVFVVLLFGATARRPLAEAALLGLVLVYLLAVEQSPEATIVFARNALLVVLVALPVVRAGAGRATRR